MRRMTATYVVVPYRGVGQHESRNLSYRARLPASRPSEAPSRYSLRDVAGRSKCEPRFNEITRNSKRVAIVSRKRNVSRSARSERVLDSERSWRFGYWLRRDRCTFVLNHPFARDRLFPSHFARRIDR